MFSAEAINYYWGFKTINTLNRKTDNLSGINIYKVVKLRNDFIKDSNPGMIYKGIFNLQISGYI